MSACEPAGRRDDPRAVLERIALHQTRLHTPGLGLDAKGVALGAKGLVLLPSIDRLVALLSVYSRERSLEDLLPTLVIRVVRSKLGTREVALELAAESSDRMDRVADDGAPRRRLHVHRHEPPLRAVPRRRRALRLRRARAPHSTTRASRSTTSDSRSSTTRSRRIELARCSCAHAARDPRADSSTAGCDSSWPSRGSARPSCTTSCARASTARCDRGVAAAERLRRDAGPPLGVPRPRAARRMRPPPHETPGVTVLRAGGPGRRGRDGLPPPHRPPRVPGLRSRRARAPARARRRAVVARASAAHGRRFGRSPASSCAASRRACSSIAASAQAPSPVRVAMKLAPSAAAWRSVTASWIRDRGSCRCCAAWRTRCRTRRSRAPRSR